MKSPNPPTELPAEFLARMRALLSGEEYAAFVAAFDRPPRVGLRVNTLKISVADFITLAPFSLAPLGAWEPAGFLVTDGGRPGRHPYHDAGLYYLQEPSAMVAAALLAPASGERVLDLAAAPGGKSTHLLSRMTPAGPNGRVSALRRGLTTEGLLIANDVHAGRARLLADNLARWGAVNALVTQDDPARIAAAFGPVFDRVLIDAPCSGEGMFRRGEPVEWSEAIVAACARRQRGIMAHAPSLVRPGGRLLYATCTFAPEENEQLIAAYLADHPAFQMTEPERFAGFDRGRPEWASEAPAAAQLARAVRLWPHRFPGEGHFLALMERARADNRREAPSPFQPNPPSREALRLWRAFVDDTLTVALPEERLHARKDRLYLLPAAAIDPGHVRVVHYGLLLGEARPGRFHPAHGLALALRVEDVGRSLNYSADDEQLAAYRAGADLPESGPDGWVLITVDGYGLGWGKRAAGRLKNHYPHHLRRNH